MAHITFSATVAGTGSTELPVTFPEGETVEIKGMGSGNLPFQVRNSLDRAVSLPSLSVTVEGPSKDKVTVSLMFDAMTLPAGATVDNGIQVEAKESLSEGDTAVVTVSGEE